MIDYDSYIDKTYGDKIGEKFCSLTVLEIFRCKGKQMQVKCLCECGNTCVKTLTKVLYGYTSSCGCTRRSNPLSQETKDKIAKALSGNKNGYAARKLKLNESVFENIEDKEVCYWLGFIAADGSIIHNKNGGKVLRLKLSVKDVLHLEKFVKFTETEAAIKYIEPSVKRNKGNNTYVSLNLSSTKLCDTLEKYGIVPRKTYTLAAPNFIPENNVKDYIRGYFDGDGWASIVKKTKSPTFGVMGNEDVMLFFQQVLIKNCGVSSNRLTHDLRNENTISKTRTLSYTGNLCVRRIYDYLYYDGCVKLERKFNVYFNHFAENITEVG